MIVISPEEVLLLKLLQQYFGFEQVIPNMSLSAVCGGKVSHAVNGNGYPEGVDDWAKRVKCLFTIVDSQDNPKLVVEIEVAADGVLESERYAHDVLFREVLEAHEIKHLRVSRDELDDLGRAGRSLTIYHVLKDRFLTEDSSLD